MNPDQFRTIIQDSHNGFGLHNLPLGVVLHRGKHAVCTRLGDSVVLLEKLSQCGWILPVGISVEALGASTLNPLLACGRTALAAFRISLQDFFKQADAAVLCKTEGLFLDASVAEMLLPLSITDYTDFYSSVEHATNVGMMFRDPANALLPNWKHLPVGYHGRAGSIIVSGTNFHRPSGQFKKPDEAVPSFGPSKQLDIEVEMAFVVCAENGLGNPVPVDKAENFIAGLMLFNDWSARDIQAWEYVPLGPFLGKNFASTLAPWLITLDALEPFRVDAVVQDVEVLPYLKDQTRKTFDIRIECELISQQGGRVTITETNYKYLYWTIRQQLAHHTINGCSIHVGDVYASGTISGSEEKSFGSLLERCWKGTKPLSLSNGETRVFLQDGDTVVMRAFCENNDLRLSFGEAVATLLPAKTIQA